jgi:hypothetical protein
MSLFACFSDLENERENIFDEVDEVDEVDKV